MIKKRINLENLGYKVIIIIFAIFQIAILINIFAFSDSTAYIAKKTFLLPNKLLLIIGLALCVLAWLLTHKHEGSSNNKISITVFLTAASLILFFLQLEIMLHMYFYTGWDAGGIRNTVYDIVVNHRAIGTDDRFYPFSIYPNNVNITAILVLIERLCIIFGRNGYIGCLLVSALLVNLAGVFTFLSTLSITQKSSYAAFVWFMFALMAGLSPWISIPYTDTYAILFPILAFYLYVSMKPDKRYYFRWFWIGFLCLFGYTIKPTTIIVLIAIGFLELWKVLSRFDKRVLLNYLVSVILITSAVIPVYAINTFSKNLMGIDLDKNQEFTLYHFAMMGLNADRDGVYSQDDVDFSRSFSTVQERNDANIEVIKQRLTDFGFLGYVRFLSRKALVNFSDGSFAWNAEGNFFAEIPERKGNFALFLKEIYYPDGKYYSLFLTCEQILWFVILLLLPGMCLKFTKPDFKSMAAILVILGISAFVMLFEARARQLYCFSPFFIMGAGIGLNLINQKIINKKGEAIS